MKISQRFRKSLKENKSKRGIEKVIKVKIEDFDRVFMLSKQKITETETGWVVKKIDATSQFGAYRIIIAKNLLSKKVMYDFYFKNSQSDMSHEDYNELKDFLLDCDQDEFYNNLDDFGVLELN